MENFFKDIATGYWWISVVLVGLLINVISNFIFSILSSRNEKWSEKRRRKLKMELEAQKETQDLYYNSLKNFYSELKNSESKKILLGQKIIEATIEIKHRVTQSMILILFGLIMSIGYLNYGIEGGMILFPIFFILIPVFYFMWDSMKIIKRRKLLNDLLSIVTEEEKEFYNFLIKSQDKTSLLDETIENFVKEKKNSAPNNT